MLQLQIDPNAPIKDRVPIDELEYLGFCKEEDKALHAVKIIAATKREAEEKFRSYLLVQEVDIKTHNLYVIPLFVLDII